MPSSCSSAARSLPAKVWLPDPDRARRSMCTLLLRPGKLYRNGARSAPTVMDGLGPLIWYALLLMSDLADAGNRRRTCPPSRGDETGRTDEAWGSYATPVLVALVLGVVNVARLLGNPDCDRGGVGRVTEESCSSGLNRGGDTEVLRRVQRHGGRRPHREAGGRVHCRHVVGRLRRLDRHRLRPRPRRRQRRRRGLQPEVRHLAEHAVGDLCGRRLAGNRRRGRRDLSRGATSIAARSPPATTDCSWTVLTGSTLTLFQTPDAGNIFTGWGGACSGTGEGPAPFR